MYCSTSWGMDNNSFDRLFTSYVENISPTPPINNFIGQLLEMENNPSPKCQFFVLSTISNFHWKGNPSAKDPNKIVTPRIGYPSHMLNTPNIRYLPSSPRNRVMMYLRDNDYEKLDTQINYIKKLDCEEDEEEMEENTEEPVPKRRRLTARAKKVTKENVISKYIQPQVQELIDACKIDRPVYSTYKQQLLASGTIKWRFCQNGKNICVMNDINSVTGHLIPNSFVHVSCEQFEEGEVIKCTCEIYKFLLHSLEEEDLQDRELDSTSSCMHCRFFKEHLMGAYEAIIQGVTPFSRPLHLVQNSLQYMNDPVLLLGEAYRNGTTKFSVKGNDHFALVTLTFHSGSCYIKCHAGICAATYINKTRMAKSASLSERKILCSHLKTCYDNISVVKKHFPDYFKSDGTTQDETHEEEVTINSDQNNEDDESLDKDLSTTFDIETGLWKYKGLSTHKPKEMLDEKLQKYTRLRIQWVVENSDSNTAVEMKPDIRNDDGSYIKCSCGLEYSESGYVSQGIASLYTRVGTVSLKYSNVICPRNECSITYQEIAKEAGIFFFTQQTCAGDEIGWDFISCVKASKISFTAFCNQMSRMYETTHKDSRPFMAVKTFIGWFFSWLSAFKIDFRKHIDPFCGYDPEILACDGTHIGVSLKHLKLDNPVTKPDIEDEVPVAHKQEDRVLFKDKDVRRHVRYKAKKYLNLIPDDKLLEHSMENSLTVDVLNRISPEQPLKMFLLPFLRPVLSPEIIRVQAELLLQLSGEQGIISVIPFSSLTLLRTICDKTEQGDNCAKELGMMRKFNSQISDLIWLGVQHGSTEYITQFLRYLMEQLEQIHSSDPQPTPVEEFKNTYDPRTGTAYYFTPSGDRVRNLPNYEMTRKNQRNKKKENDDMDGKCRKKYPKVSFGGYSYMFLWFCPVHGHCYGFHLIDGAEGRKDVFSSLMKYKKTMPKELFYDNACQLINYCLNREPELFKNTRFWHDLFHSIAHLCGINYKSTRVEGLEGINSEICEQVNSYLQCVKYTGAHLSQEHFVFFLQFFLYLLNVEKTQRQRQMAKIALAGIE